jgi:uncharacterized protein (TIGR00369 family)
MISFKKIASSKMLLPPILSTRFIHNSTDALQHAKESASQTKENQMSSISAFQRIEESFKRQGLMQMMGAKLLHVEKGSCHIELPFSSNVTQQQNNFHGGAIGAIADIAAGYSGLTAAPDNMEVVTVEYKINFLASLSGGKLIAKGRVIKGGKRLIITTSEVYHYSDDSQLQDGKKNSKKETLCAVLQQTLVPVEKKY